MSSFEFRVACGAFSTSDCSEGHNCDGEGSEAKKAVQDIGAPVAIRCIFDMGGGEVEGDGMGEAGGDCLYNRLGDDGGEGVIENIGAFAFGICKGRGNLFELDDPLFECRTERFKGARNAGGFAAVAGAFLSTAEGTPFLGLAALGAVDEASTKWDSR